MQRRRLDHKADHKRAYRVIVIAPSWQKVLGPYATLSAAKGMVTREKRGLQYSKLEHEVYIEQTPEGWERVEAA
jgi:hypothetical protein